MHRMTPLGVGEGNPSFSSARGGEKQLFQQTFFFVQRWRTAPITSSFLLVPQRWRFDRRRKEKHFQHHTNMFFSMAVKNQTKAHVRTWANTHAPPRWTVRSTRLHTRGKAFLFLLRGVFVGVVGLYANAYVLLGEEN